MVKKVKRNKKLVLEVRGNFIVARRPRKQEPVAVLSYQWSKAPWNKKEIPRFLFQVKGGEVEFATTQQAADFVSQCGYSEKERVKILTTVIRSVTGSVSDFDLEIILGVSLKEIQEPLSPYGDFVPSNKKMEVIFEKETNTLYSLDLLEV